MDGVIGTFVVGAAGGLAYIAYRHPIGYRRLHKVVLGIFIIINITASAYLWGVMHGIDLAKPHLSEAAKVIVRAERVELAWIFLWIMGTNFAVFFYSLFLASMPLFLDLQEPDKVKRD